MIELCTGGSLDHVLKQDKKLPLNEIRKIGADLLRGLHALHKSEICVGDLSPSRCLFDGPGLLKINNLSCAHYESEELDSVYQSVLEELGGGGIEADSLDGVDGGFTSPSKSAQFQAPEALIGSNCLKSDIWSCGVILYQMYTGTELYNGSDSELLLLQMRKTPPSQLLGKMRPDENCAPGEFDLFVDLLGACLVPEQSSRATVETLIKHPFWKNKIKLDNIDKDLSSTNVINESINVKHSHMEPLELSSPSSSTMRHSNSVINSIDSNRTLTNSVLCEEAAPPLPRPHSGGDTTTKLQPQPPLGNPGRVFPRQTKSAAVASVSTTAASVTDSLKRQKSRVLQSANARANVVASEQSVVATKTSPVKQSGLPQQSLTTMSIMTDMNGIIQFHIRII